MTSGVEPRVRVHDALRSSSLLPDVTPRQIEATSPRSFTIEQCWSRGCFEASLFAPAEERSFAWRGAFLRDWLPLLPLDRRGRTINPATFWLEVARLNGEPQAALQKRLGSDAATLERILQTAEQQNILYRLPHWTAPGEVSARSDLVYWTDSGLLHRLLNARVPEEMGDPARGKSFEGFAINALAIAAGPRARPRVWRRAEDEIDLILEWGNNTERWAIEITYSKTKKLRAGFQRGCEELNPTRLIVVQREAGAVGDARRLDRMRLEDALREVLDQRDEL